MSKEQNLGGCRKNGVPCLPEAIKAGLEKEEGGRENGPAGQGKDRTDFASETGLESPDPGLRGALLATGQPSPGANPAAPSTFSLRGSLVLGEQSLSSPSGNKASRLPSQDPHIIASPAADAAQPAECKPVWSVDRRGC